MEEFFDLPAGRYIGKNYKILNYLGNGWEGEVYKVEEKETGIIRVAKLFYQSNHREKSRHIKYAKKLYNLRSCPIIIQYHHKDSVYLQNRKVDFLVSDYVDGEVLSQYLKNKTNKTSIFEALHIFYSLVQGIEHIHFLGEYHGDIHTDNIIVKRKGLGFGIRIIDILHLGKSTVDKIQADVYDLISVLYEIVGGGKYYKKSHPNIKQIICGRKKQLIKQKFKSAGDIRLFLDNLKWT